MYVIYTIRTWKDHRVKEKAGQCIYRKDIEKIIKRESEEWKNDRKKPGEKLTFDIEIQPFKKEENHEHTNNPNRDQ